MDLKKIRNRLRNFATDRDWEQFHNPKNLTIALSVEVSELLEIFQWSKNGGLDEINDKEQYFIKHYIKKVKDMEDYYSINYSGENQPKYKEV